MYDYLVVGFGLYGAVFAQQAKVAGNSKLYFQYKELAKKEDKVILGGRLGEYKYYDMDAVIDAALAMAEKELTIK